MKSELPSPSPPRKPWWHRAFVRLFDCTPSEAFFGGGFFLLSGTTLVVLEETRYGLPLLIGWGVYYVLWKLFR